MKSIYFVLIACITFISCQKLDELTQFDIDYSEDFTLPSTNNITIPINITSPAISSNLEEKMGQYNSAVNLIEDITIKSVILTITNPDTLDYSFLKEVSLYIVDGSEMSILASATDIPETVTNELEFETSDTDVLPYLLKDSFQIKTIGTMKSGTTVDIENRIDLVFTVDAKLI